MTPAPAAVQQPENHTTSRVNETTTTQIVKCIEYNVMPDFPMYCNLVYAKL